MKVLILAAGKGSRISRYLSGKPKCTVNIGNIPLIEYTVKKLNDLGINDIGIITGYNKDEIEKVLKNYNIKFFNNPFFDVTNSIASAWFARDFITEDDDIIIMNADVFMEEALIKHILNSQRSPVLFSDESRKEEADYKLFYKDNILINYGKELKDDDITGEYIGVAKINRDFISIFKNNLNKLISEQNHSLWWENILYSLSNKNNIYVENISGMFWAEVDYIEDYERILAFRQYSLEFNLKIKEM
ncbi:bifunctional N-acetylglucosamine-1-phosphate uridyltransferase/glucosamine-1-phosphate acetyltransferase [uncultured Clostridium sp.]|uniref:phosphocholine cytidylyltransferase family protein n=1 Tax=uncultured Clostridium sp. TaxID=59620 RepID=UPI000821A186|nr:phosphocholine cytidylyltransferase family protein [uncultured Clostridium sp.]SCJ41983.1 bifunctional N-acetylglucosamine-1-phosphate uridyltransferase/glucosamine-1-phosphate acetyltransferase [uncultured Clostridium sp.]